MRRERWHPVVVGAATSWLVVVTNSAVGDPNEGGDPMALEITSPSFEAMGEIPSRHTCEGDDTSPELRWSGVPEEAKSLVLIVDDPDAPDPSAPRMTWVHWVLYDIPRDTRGLREGVTEAELPRGTRQGVNDWKRTGYGGPCPPIGRHRYFHKLYALSEALGDLGEPTRAEVERAMQSKVIAHAELVGTYEKSR